MEQCSAEMGKLKMVRAPQGRLAGTQMASRDSKEGLPSLSSICGGGNCADKPSPGFLAVAVDIAIGLLGLRIETLARRRSHLCRNDASSILPAANGGLATVRAAFIALLIALLPLLARAEARIALLIGNQAYDPSVGVLKNPYNDIAVVGQALGRQGFEVLPPIKDAKRAAILGGVRDLARRLNAAGAGAIGFIYYSGHGAAEKDTNINYLIPVDAKEPGTTAFWDESVKLDDVLRLFDGARAAAKFIVFDACRSELQLPTKDTTKGLVPVAEQQGMFIAYASAPGHTASDKGEGSGPYAAALELELGRPGLDHLNLFQNVKEDVLASTVGAQQPWESNGLGRRAYLTGPSTPGAPISEAERAWIAAKE